MNVQRAKVVLIEKESGSMGDSWIDRLDLVRDPRGALQVKAWKHVSTAHGRRSGSKLWSKSKTVTRPLALRLAIDSESEMLGISFDWVEILPRVASLNWLCAAVIAKSVEQEVPEPPHIDELLAQRSLARLGKVKIELEWGYDSHQLVLPFDQWLRIVWGEAQRFRTTYSYEGMRMRALWSFDGVGGVEVTYGDGAVGWTGSVLGLDYLDGPKLDGIDVAALSVEAAEHARANKHTLAWCTCCGTHHSPAFRALVSEPGLAQ